MADNKPIDTASAQELLPVIRKLPGFLRFEFSDDADTDLEAHLDCLWLLQMEIRRFVEDFALGFLDRSNPPSTGPLTYGEALRRYEARIVMYGIEKLTKGLLGRADKTLDHAKGEHEFEPDSEMNKQELQPAKPDPEDPVLIRLRMVMQAHDEAPGILQPLVDPVAMQEQLDRIERGVNQFAKATGPVITVEDAAAMMGRAKATLQKIIYDARKNDHLPEWVVPPKKGKKGICIHREKFEAWLRGDRKRVRGRPRKNLG